MAPEQAKSRPADKRSDIWAFGCVLYEMLTGKRAFQGDDVSDTLASILKDEPTWHALPSASTSLTSVLRRCLEKDPRRRLRDMGDVQLLMEDASRASSVIRAPSVSALRTWWMAAAATLGLIVGGTAGALNVAISADGSRMVYTSRGPDARLVLREIDHVETKAIVTQRLTGSRHEAGRDVDDTFGQTALADFCQWLRDKSFCARRHRSR